MKYLIIALSVLLIIALMFGYVMSFSTTFGYINSIFGTINNAIKSISGTLGFNVFNVEIDNTTLLEKTYSNGYTGYEIIEAYLERSQLKVENGIINTEEYGEVSTFVYANLKGLKIEACSPYCWEMYLKEEIPTEDSVFYDAEWVQTQKSVIALVLSCSYVDDDNDYHDIDVILPLVTDNRLLGEYVSERNGYVTATSGWDFGKPEYFYATNVFIMQTSNKFIPLFDTDISPKQQVDQILAGFETYYEPTYRGYQSTYGVWSASITPQYSFEQIIEKMIENGVL